MKKRDFSIELALEEAMESYIKYYYGNRETAERDFTDDFLSMGDEILDRIWPEDDEE